MSYLEQDSHAVNILPPRASTSATESDWFHLKKGSHADIIVTTGSVTNASTFSVREATSNAGSGATAIAFNYYSVSTASSDTFSTLTAATAGGVSTGTTNNLSFVISLNGSDLSDGSPYVSLLFSTAATIAIQSVAIIQGLRWGGDVPASAID